MGVGVYVEHDAFVVRLTGGSALFALRTRVRLPLTDIATADVVPQGREFLRGLQTHGIRGVYRALGVRVGWRRPPDFVDIGGLPGDDDWSLVIECRPGARWSRLVLERPDAFEIVAELRRVGVAAPSTS